MAFLCPVRIRRGRKKDGDKLSSRVPSIGRITGSASIETLVRVGIEKENGLSPDSKMVVLHDFTPCVDDELEVKRGQIVNVLYQENDWVYVIAENSQEGFIPHSYCVPYDSQVAVNVKHKKIPRTETDPDLDQLSSKGTISLDSGQQSDAESYGGTLLKNSENLSASQISLLGVHPFFKDPAGRFVVLYSFVARDENDVTVERGEVVTVLNREDPDWFWIIRSDGQEGFIPSAFVYPAEELQETLNAQALNNNNSNINNNNCPGGSGVIPAQRPCTAAPPSDEIRFHGTELVMLYDYKAQAPDDLSVRRGDWVYADLSNQTVEGWLWAYAPKTRQYGFIPKAYARPPAMTSL